MRYMGGKALIARQLATAMLESVDSRSIYVEPFVGAAHVAAKMVPHFERSILADISPDLIELWRGLQEGWQPPLAVSRDDYNALRTEPPSALRGFAGYGCSFGGKWFGGYARGKDDKCEQEAANSLANILPALKSADFILADYRDLLIPDGAVVYLDPPYAGTTCYPGIPSFDAGEFWPWAERLSSRAQVFVSEYAAPDDWKALWTGRRRGALGIHEVKPVTLEHLWVAA